MGRSLKSAGSELPGLSASEQEDPLTSTLTPRHVYKKMRDVFCAILGGDFVFTSESKGEQVNAYRRMVVVSLGCTAKWKSFTAFMNGSFKACPKFPRKYSLQL